MSRGVPRTADPSVWAAIRKGMLGDLSIGGRTGARWVAGERSSMLIGPDTYVDLRGRGIAVTPPGKRRRVINHLLDDGETANMWLPEPSDGALTYVGSVAFSTAHIVMLLALGHVSAYRGSNHLRTAPIGGSFVLAHGADTSCMDILHGWTKCQYCNGTGHVH